MFFQQDGAPLLWGPLARDFLEETSPNWREGATNCPPDFKLDFFSFGVHQGQDLCHTNC